VCLQLKAAGCKKGMVINMKLGIRAHDMERAPLETLVANIKNKGLTCTQLALSKVIDNFNVEAAALTPGMAFHIRDIFAKNQVDIAVLGCYLNMTDPDAASREKIHDIYKAHIRFARHLGCGMVGTETGAVNSAYTFEEANHSKEALDWLIENVKRIVDYAERMGVIFSIEPVYTHIMSSLDRTYQVLQAVNSPNLQVIFDPVNILHAGNYKEQDDIIKGAFELFGKDIAAIHVKDFKMVGDTFKPLPSGQGDFNYELLFKLIKEKKPYIHILMEDTTPANVFQAIGYLKNIYYTD
jgi:L-ribulose-5-phosphate 3-epimerase